MEIVKFKNIFFFDKKSDLKASDSDENGNYPFFTSSSIVSKKTNNPFYSEISLVIGNGGSANIHYVDTPFSATSHCYIATRKYNSLNVKYVYYYLLTNIYILERGFIGVGIKNISTKYIEEIDIPLPSFVEQERIVAILDKVKNLIVKREKSIELYNSLLQSIFFDLFGDPGKNNKGWQTKKLEQHIEFMGDIGSNGSNAIISKNLVMKDEEDYALMVRTTNLRSNDFTNKVKYVSKKTYDFFEKTKIFGGEIIMNKIGSGAGDIWIMPLLDKKVSLGLNQLVIRLKDLDHIFLFHYLSTEYGKMIVKSKVRGAAVQSITKTEINQLPIIYPPIELQNQFAKKVHNIELSKQKKKSSLFFMQNLFSSLAQLAFKGKLDFNTAVDLEVLLENDYDFFKKNSDNKTIKLLLERLDKNELNANKLYLQDHYNKAKMFVFHLLEDNKIEQIYEQEKVKLVVK